MLSRGQGVNQPRPALACHPVGPIGPEKLNYFVHATSRPAPRSLGKPQQYLGLQSGLNQAVFTNKIRVTLPPPTRPQAGRYCSQLWQVADSRPLRASSREKTRPLPDRQPSAGLPFPHRLGVESWGSVRATGGARWGKKPPPGREGEKLEG